MKKVARATIDFETRSSSELKKVGAFRYGMNWDTRALCLAYHIPGQEVKLWHPELSPPADLFFWIEDGGMVEAHNAEFEWCIWNYVQTKNGWPKLTWKQLYCSAAKAAVVGLPRGLESLCDVLNTEVRKDKDGKKIMMRLARLKRPTKKEPDSWDDDPVKRAKLYSYCVDDVRAEMDASDALPDLSPLEHKMWRHTEMINERGIYCDVQTAARAAEFARRFERELVVELKVVTKGEVKTPRQNAKFLNFLKSHGVELLNVQAKTVQAALENEMPYPAKRALQIRAALSKSSLGKFNTMIATAGPDKRIRGTLLHHGASTGRDTGRFLQPQNIVYDKSGKSNPEQIIAALKAFDYEDFKAIFPNVFESLSFTLRGMLMAAPGKKFVAADFAAIEARVLLWLANDEEGLGIFHANEDIYVDMAKAIYALNDASWEALDKETKKAYRQLGKQAILGLGYGMGPDKFVITCKGYGIDITKDFAVKVVKLYRTRRWAVKAFWDALNTAALSAVKRPGKTYSAGKIKFYMWQRFLVAQLPSGRKLYYCDPLVRTEETQWGERERLGFYAPVGQGKKWGYEETYGGKLAENMTQAVAADLMREGALRQEIAGFPIVIRVHDELVAEVDADRDCLEEFENLMSELPAWAEGCPVTVEGWEGPRFKK